MFLINLLKKIYALRLLKKIMTALHRKKFDKVIRLVDECSMSEDDMKEAVLGTLEANGYSRVDGYRKKNVYEISEYEDDPFIVESYITADKGRQFPLCLILEIEFEGGIRSRLDIDA